MSRNAKTSSFQTRRSKHNIAFVYNNLQAFRAHQHPAESLAPDVRAYPAASPDFLTQTGTFFGPGSTSRPSLGSSFSRFGLGSANSSSIAAASSSAYSSMARSINWMMSLRVFAFRFMRLSRKEAMRSLCTLNKYWTILRSLSSAVGMIGDPWSLRQANNYSAHVVDRAEFVTKRVRNASVTYAAT